MLECFSDFLWTSGVPFSCIMNANVFSSCVMPVPPLYFGYLRDRLLLSSWIFRWKGRKSFLLGPDLDFKNLDLKYEPNGTIHANLGGYSSAKLCLRENVNYLWPEEDNGGLKYVYQISTLSIMKRCLIPPPLNMSWHWWHTSDEKHAMELVLQNFWDLVIDFCTGISLLGCVP